VRKSSPSDTEEKSGPPSPRIKKKWRGKKGRGKKGNGNGGKGWKDGGKMKKEGTRVAAVGKTAKETEILTEEEAEGSIEHGTAERGVDKGEKATEVRDIPTEGEIPGLETETENDGEEEMEEREKNEVTGSTEEEEVGRESELGKEMKPQSTRKESKKKKEGGKKREGYKGKGVGRRSDKAGKKGRKSPTTRE
jgi:hypothetical protein